MPWLVIIRCGCVALRFSLVHVHLYPIVSCHIFGSTPEDFPGISGSMKACRHLSKVKVFCKTTRVEVVFLCAQHFSQIGHNLSVWFSIHLCSLPKGNSCAAICSSGVSKLRQRSGKPLRAPCFKREIQISIWQQGCPRQG